ncbi:MAG: hypothetical protein J5695_06345 [Bacteroidales bacterium]|nr:hypothetical protein [Bacteroidales bacterium]
MKKLLTVVLTFLIAAPCLAQDGDLKPIYKGISLSAGVQTTSAAMFAYNGDKPFPTFNAEAGYLYMAKLGESRFFFETGAYLGLINIGFDFYHDAPPVERVISRHYRLKIPFNFDYTLPLGGGVNLMPSLGLGFTASYVTNISNGVVEDSDPGIGIVLPHVGLSVMKDHFLIGLSHDFFASIQSEIPLNGILMLNASYLF